VASFFAIAFLNLPFPLVVAAAAVAGVLGARWVPAQFAGGGGHGASDKSWGPALIDDQTPTPPHALFRKSRLAAVVGVGALLWLVPIAVLVAAGAGTAR
jgi:chromate transporter